MLKFGAKWNPILWFKTIQEVIITAFSTSSSNATLPTTLRVAEEKLKLPKAISSFVLTVGSTANQNGTALFEGITVLFLAQFYGIELTTQAQFTVVLMSIMAGIGTAGVPGGSIPLIVILLQSIGVPAEGIGIILGVDRLLDMSRTVVNVVGDMVLATLASGPPSAEFLAAQD
jgi:DAACS family dicarboxylate/amino acid:cation (Na+ or H+) symporter